MNSKIRRIIILVGICMVFLNTISYGVNMTSNPQIHTRGLTFNTGVASDQIRLLKDFFRVRGESNVPWGYNYDNRTKELVMNYQRSIGLKADGIGGKLTIDRINQEISEKDYRLGLRIISTSIKGHMIIINKSSNTLYFLKDGIIQESYPVATGKTIGLTPEGKFKVVVKYKDPAWGGAGVSDPVVGGAPNNPLGRRWIGISYGGGSRYGIHGNSSPRSIGTYASLGCVRMFNGDVEKLYEKININTPVWIGPEDLLKSYGVKFKSNYKEKIVKEEKTKEEEEKVNIELNGEKIELKNSVINRDGTTYYPFREILESIYAEVIWDNENKKVVGILGENYVKFELDSNEYVNNYEYKYLPEGQKVFVQEDRTYVPIRNLMEGLGYDVDWRQSPRTIIINARIPEEIQIPEDVQTQGEYETQEDEEDLEDSKI